MNSYPFSVSAQWKFSECKQKYNNNVWNVREKITAKRVAKSLKRWQSIRDMKFEEASGSSNNIVEGSIVGSIVVVFSVNQEKLLEGQKWVRSISTRCCCISEKRDATKTSCITYSAYRLLCPRPFSHSHRLVFDFMYVNICMRTLSLQTRDKRSNEFQRVTYDLGLLRTHCKFYHE